MDDRPIPAWVPTDQTIEHANLSDLMAVAGVTSVQELHRWSVDASSTFWGAIVDGFDIPFVSPPDTINASDNPTAPDWLPGASFNIVDACLDHAGDAVAIVAGSTVGLERITIDDLRSRVAAFAAGFRAAGFAQGDRIAIMMPMTVEAVVAYLGIIAAGGVVASIADSFSTDEIAVRLSLTEPVAVVTQDAAERAGKVIPMFDKLPEDAPRAIVVDSGAHGGRVDLGDDDVWWDDFVVSGAAYESRAMSADAHTNILFSSGTTGTPKVIPWTQTTPLKAAMDGRYHQDIHAGDVVAWPTNLGWMMGPWLIYASLLNEATIGLYADAPTTAGFVRFVGEANVSMLGVVPSIVAVWRSGNLLQEDAWPSLRVLSSTGEASNADDYRWLMESTGAPVIEYCGGTEVGGGYITGTVLEPAVPSRFTTPTLGLDFVILGEDGQPTDTGEIFLVPPSIGLSTELLDRDHFDVYYAGVPEHGERQLRRHGDQMRRHPDGTYQALGRVDDTMNLGGIKVSSADLEGAIGELDGVTEIAAIGSPPSGGGPERLIVFAAGRDDLDPNALKAEIQQRIRAKLNPLFKVHDVIVVPSLPRTASQKVMRRTLRSEYDG